MVGSWNLSLPWFVETLHANVGIGWRAFVKMSPHILRGNEARVNPIPVTELEWSGLPLG